MSQNTKPGKSTLCDIFPVAGPALKDKPKVKETGFHHNKQQTSHTLVSNKKLQGNKPSVEKAVYTTYTREISFEKFLQSKGKKP